MAILKKLGAFSLASVLAFALAEGGLRLVLRRRGEAYRPWAARQELELIVGQMTESVAEVGRRSGEKVERDFNFILHPFAAYTFETNLAVQERAIENSRAASADESFDIFLFGGSVAAIFAGNTGGTEALLEALKRSPAFAQKKLNLYRLAIPGYKQPQQLSLLAYMLARGARPELVINLDGLNELRQSMNNIERGAPPTWPSDWHWTRVTSMTSPGSEELDAWVEVKEAQGDARELLARCERFGLWRSALSGLWLRRKLEAARSRWSAGQERFLAATKRSKETTRQRVLAVSEAEKFALPEAAALWHQSSLAMQHLCAPLGIRYLHVLQPTLHDRGSKVLTVEEERRGLEEGQYDENVSAGYALLRAELLRLQAVGVEALDLSYLFKDVQETIYYDAAHFKEQGNLMLAQALARQLLTGD